VLDAETVRQIDAQDGDNRAQKIKWLIEAALPKPEKVARRKPRDPAHWPPGMSSAEIEALINATCGCKGSYDCDCVSVFNKAKIKAWTQHNTAKRIADSG
jgi:hypothetical protein